MLSDLKIYRFLKEKNCFIFLKLRAQNSVFPLFSFPLFCLQDFLDEMKLVFTNCEAYNPPRSRVYREGAKLKAFVLKRMKELDLGEKFVAK